jgi:predicted PurR-regulated permease PerM
MGLVIVPFLKMMAPYALAILMGVILAVLCYPAYRRLLDRGFSPGSSSLMVVMGLLFLVLGPILSFVINAVEQTVEVARALPSIDALNLQSLFNRISHWKPLADLLGRTGEIEQQLRSAAGILVQSVSGVVLGFATQIPELLLQTALALFACYFLLIDGQELVGWTGRLLPLSPNIQRVLYTSFRETAVSVVIATVAAAAVQALMMVLAFFVLGIPAAFLAGGATFIFAWIPMLGSFPVWGTGAVYLYMQGSYIKAGVLIVLGIITSLADNVVRPLMLKGRQEMHPLVSLVAIFGGIAMFGILGVFLGPILTAMAISLLNTWPHVARQAGITLGDEVEEIVALDLPQGPPVLEPTTRPESK